MGMQGNLHDMAIADLIQHNCQDRKTACLSIDFAGKKSQIYFKDGQVIHASSGNQKGEEIVFEILGYEEGAFNLELGVEAPEVTITHSWTSLLIEGARRIDEGGLDFGELVPEINLQPEVSSMGQKLDDVLKELSGEVSGYILSSVIGMDGMSAAFHSTAKMDPDLVSAQMALLIKLVDTSTTKSGAGVVEDNLTTTQNAYILIRHLPGKEYFLCIIADHRQGSLGNMRMISKLYTDRIAKLLAS
jgi:predicted regulator of Ras-like GTPase activity (Roadblock/LC7/MglB family)